MLIKNCNQGNQSCKCNQGNRTKNQIQIETKRTINSIQNTITFIRKFTKQFTDVATCYQQKLESDSDLVVENAKAIVPTIWLLKNDNIEFWKLFKNVQSKND